MVLETLFWVCVALIVYTHVGYTIALAILRLLLSGRRAVRAGGDAVSLPSVSLVIAAYDEEDVIADKVTNTLALDYPRELLQIIVASDGSADRTVNVARAAGADLVLDLPRGGKITGQNSAVESARGDLVAFSDANSFWEPGALRGLVAPFADESIGYACGQVSFINEDGDNQEGIYWRYEMKVRELESGLGGVTAGNGAIYAVRRSAYVALPPSGSHDLSFPFEMARQGLRSVYVPVARASELMVPTLSGEWSRKRRMMIGLWDIVIGERMISPRGYSPMFAFEIFSHRLLRYLTPFLHLITLGLNIVLVAQSAGTVYRVTLGLQVLLLAAAFLAPLVPFGPLRIARYYVIVTASIVFGLWDRWRQGPPGAWEKAEGTR